MRTPLKIRPAPNHWICDSHEIAWKQPCGEDAECWMADESCRIRLFDPFND